MGELWLPIANLVSICALLVWHPANPNDTITRLLFPGSTPQHKIFKGLEKLKKLECLKSPTCSATTLQETKSKQPSKGKESKGNQGASCLTMSKQKDKSGLQRKKWKRQGEQTKKGKG